MSPTRKVRWVIACAVAALAGPAAADFVEGDEGALPAASSPSPAETPAPCAPSRLETGHARNGREDAALPAPAEAREAPAEIAEVGMASWYGPRFHGRLTACGEIFDENALTAAHPWLAFGTIIAVTNLENGCRVTLRVTDRGPYVGKRILDCSKAAAEELGYIGDGVARIRWEVVEAAPEKPRRRARSRKAPTAPSVAAEPVIVHEPLVALIAEPGPS